MATFFQPAPIPLQSPAAFRHVPLRGAAAAYFLSQSSRPAQPLAANAAEAARLRALADELEQCGSVQTAAVCRQMADEVEGR